MQGVSVNAGALAAPHGLWTCVRSAIASPGVGANDGLAGFIICMTTHWPGWDKSAICCEIAELGSCNTSTAR